MFSAFTIFSNPFFVSRCVAVGLGAAVDVKSVAVKNVEARHDKRTRTLKHLLKLNHANHSIIYHQLQFHNHMPHILGSAYLLGAKALHLNDVYEKGSKELEDWEDSPNEVSTYDWRDYLGDRRYQRAYIDFFEDELVLNGYEWQKVLENYLFKGEEPLINCLVTGLGHPLIHLSYAYELSSRELAMEALGLTATSYNYMHKYLDVTSYTRNSTFCTNSALEILERVAADESFDGLFEHRGGDNIDRIFTHHEGLILEHWNAWEISNPTKQFEDSQRAATALLAATREGGPSQYDFFFVHLLTTSHAVRILLPEIPAKYHINLLRQWWLLTLAVYIGQLRPAIDEESVLNYDLGGKDWCWVEKQAVEGKWSMDAHYVKCLRAIKEAARTWGDHDMFYLKAGVKFGESFGSWGGFGPTGAEEMYVPP
ncbi:hypothetical protein MMC26_002214 [Xylographa opegraphella]|nr:hypothetical protein [Xylographa opegraphella]